MRICGILASRIDAFGCSCFVRMNACQELRTTDVVFEATVRAIRPYPPETYDTPPREELIEFDDIRPLKGEAPTSIVAVGPASSCHHDFEIGSRYFVQGLRRPDGTITAGRCSVTRPAEHASELVKYVQALAGSDDRGRLIGRVQIPGLISNPAGSYDTAIPSAVVTVRGPVEQSARTDSDGAFTVLGLPAGTYRVEVTLPSPYRETAHVKEGTFTLEGSFACVEHSVAPVIDSVLSGTVVDDSGGPLPNVFLFVLTPEMVSNPWIGGAYGITTDVTGNYSISGLPPGRYLVAVEPYMLIHPMRPAYLRAPDGRFDFQLELGAASACRL